MSWYYAKNKVQLGPVEQSELERLLGAGEISPDTLVWQKGMAAWIPYSQAFSPAAVAANDGPDAVCAECGQTFDKTTMIRHGNAWVCSSCKPVFLQKLSEGMVVAGGAGRFGGFWIRLLAIVIDSIVLIIPLFLVIFVLAFGIAFMTGATNNPDAASTLMSALTLISYLFMFLMSAGYFIFFVGKYGATPGKMLLKLKIVDASGAKIGYGRATGRYFAQMLSYLTCYIGYIIAAFDPEKQSLHDRICNTRVIYK